MPRRRPPKDARTARVSNENATSAFLANHSRVLFLLSREGVMVLREVASRVGITERAVQRIIKDLEQAGYLEREKVGRQNHYRILAHRPLRHAIEKHRAIGEMLAFSAGVG